MNASQDRNKPVERIKKILDFIKSKSEQNPNTETFTIVSGELSKFDPLLENSELVQISFEKIKVENGENIKIEFRQSDSGITTITDGKAYENIVWFYVPNYPKFEEYRNRIVKQLEQDENANEFVLDGDGFFYPEGSDEESKHQLKKNSDRYKLLYLLASKKKYVSTKELSSELEISSTSVRKRVGEIRDILVEKWSLPREALFESDNASGYRITNVILKKS